MTKVDCDGRRCGAPNKDINCALVRYIASNTCNLPNARALKSENCA